MDFGERHEKGRGVCLRDKQKGWNGMKKKRYRFFIFYIVLSLIPLTSIVYADNAEDDFITYAEEKLNQVCMNFSEKETILFKATGTSPSQGEIMFDFSEGNKMIMIVADEKYKIFTGFNDDELLAAFFRMVSQYEEINNNAPQGKEVTYSVRLTKDTLVELDPLTIKTKFLMPE